ncbi:MAG: hypothetical protein IJS01_04770 [Lentisphaeria bacterium]|nr:hypothetical protein [Lentisphaeria bacterium]
MKRIFLFFAALAVFLPLGAEQVSDSGTRRLRFVQDDAQDYMVSKLYRLKYVQANDITPFVMGIVMRYNMNSSVGCIEYGANNEQMLTVTCPVKMMPYVDDFISKADRDVKIDGKVPGDIVRGTGITRAVYQPLYRSGGEMLNILVDTVIGAGPASSVYAWDKNSNQIYWKDNTSNTAYVYQFLGYIDRPVPQVTLNFTVYEVRESTLRDMGIEYLAWKNGPGLNLFETGFRVLSASSAGSAAIQAAAGPAGGFLFAPQFDASFIRLLQQNGKADIKNTAVLTVSNSDSNSYKIYFDPEFQNILKSDNDATSVTGGTLGLPAGFYQLFLQIDKPVVNIHYGESQAGYPASEAFEVKPYRQGLYAQLDGTLFFSYTAQTANVLERDDLGNELVETSQIQSSLLMPLKEERILASWERDQEVEQTIGVPFLSRIPILKYLFGTTTVSRERSRVYLTVTATMLDTSKPDGMKAGEVFQIRPCKFK